MNYHTIYSSDAYETAFTYSGNDLGAIWTEEKTVFRLWAPGADAVTVNLYKTGNPEAKDLLHRLSMIPDVKGTWVAQQSGDLHGIYYTYTVMRDSHLHEVCDPYAHTTGVNGHRAMVIDLSRTAPEGWDTDTDPNAGKAITDAVIYELHIRDLSSDPSAGIRNVGKFLGLTETGTKTPGGIPTGLDHMKDLGITHLHILPMYDYASVDESRLDIPQFNWGYDPENYNVPEGSYSTNPQDGAIRVKELKQTIQTLHRNGISVVMDVVYNHVYEAGTFCINRIVPDYFSRTNSQGIYSNGSGCGNDTASERSMVRKYLVDSVKYWADEYHIDGFRFDLVGLIDCRTIQEIVKTVHTDHPNVIFYGEGWSMETGLTKEFVPLATQRNAHLVPKFAFFSDDFRDTLRGSVFIDTATGFISGAQGLAHAAQNAWMSRTAWGNNPSQTVNYGSCHDNMALFDRLAVSAPKAPLSQRIRMNKLCAALTLTSLGIPFFQAGEEFLRSKPLPEGGFDENSYASPDSVNSLKWDTMEDPVYRNVYQYYRGLIALRKAHPALRAATAQQVERSVTPIPLDTNNAFAVMLDGTVTGDPAKKLLLVFNADANPISVTLPAGKWQMLVNEDTAGTDSIRTVWDTLTVDAVSAVVLMQE